MERKIGKIIEYNGEWYQCVKNPDCAGCSLFDTICNNDDKGIVFGECSHAGRSDGKSVIFKKLEKVGGTYEHNSVIVQKYRIRTIPVIMPKEPYMYFNAIDNTIKIEIKQNKEDMEEKKPNMKPFDLDAAKAGKPVCTRDGRKARIICFNRESIGFPIIALIKNGDTEGVYQFDDKGHSNIDDEKRGHDLMMLPEKKEGWINVYRHQIHDTLEGAEEGRKGTSDYIQTIKVEWEE